MQGDRRQIQTAVLGGADSEEPLMLPLEAIELDAFRRRHEHDTFWCGLLLGGCGLQLTTKLYTDRVCHFAHHPGRDGHPHVCGRRARGVSSADHLYVKSAAAAWLRDRDTQADFEFVQPDGAPIGSVVDIRFPRGGLRVHLDQAVAPSWNQDGHEPVLGVSVPVDRDTLIDRWYVHRIRLDSDGTARRVQIGTEAFARPTEWFGLEECKITERGLSTPAVEQIVRSRSTRPVTSWIPGAAGKVPRSQTLAQKLLRKLAEGRALGSAVIVTRTCSDIATLTEVEQDVQAELAAAVADAQCWLEEQQELRQQLVRELEKATTGADLPQVRTLLRQVKWAAHPDRTDAERAAIAGAEALVKDFAQQQQDRAAARRAQLQDERAEQAAGRARKLLAILERRGVRQPPGQMRKLVRELVNEASQAGTRIDPHLQEQINAWKARADDRNVPPQTVRPAAIADRTAVPAKRKRQSSGQSKPKKSDARTEPQSPSWSVLDVSCPSCDAPPGTHCTPGNQHPHKPRLQWLRRRFPRA
ncbi:hypothetical protein QFZ22_000083 [Streptomyces canus]|uniref:Uncharacterized protein n=1 Tax=Streptomyces canus TaxID=58343 RepID=A0AAW8F3Q3_9ACTN|nr:hypothetical protein [Streptomyces canus]